MQLLSKAYDYCLLTPGHLTMITLALFSAAYLAWSWEHLSQEGLPSVVLKAETVVPLTTNLQTGMETGAKSSYL